MPSEAVRDLVLRPGTESDAPALARLQRRARATAPMPDGIHPPADVERFLAARLAHREGRDEVWVAQTPDGPTPTGYARFTPTWLDDLYVDPAHQGQGIGSALLGLVCSRLPGGFALWVFETNTPARRFYARHGLREVEATDGRDNEEQEPDVRMEWRREWRPAPP